MKQTELTGEYPANVRENPAGLSNAAALMHLVRSNIGIGVFSIPWALSHAGLVLGPVLLFAFIMLTLTTLLSLVDCARLYSRKVGVPCMDYGDIAYYAIHFGPIKIFRKYARIGRTLMNVSIAMLQMSICCLYYVFIAQNIRQVLVSVWPGIPEDRVIMVIIWVPITLLTLSRNLSGFAWMSTVGNVLIVTAIIMILKLLFAHLPLVDSIPFTKPVQEIPVFLSSAAFTIEGVATVLPLENSMKSKEGFVWVFTGALGLLTLICMVLGVTGYIAFGSSVCGSITLNLPHNDPVSSVIRILMAFVLFFSYPLQFYVQMEIIWPKIEEKFQPTNRMCEVVSKVAVSSLLCIVAVSIPFLGSAVAFAGSLLTCPLQFIYPPLIALMTLQHFDGVQCNSAEEETDLLPPTQERCVENTMEHSPYFNAVYKPMGLLRFVKNIGTMIFGLLLTIFGLITSVSKVVHDYQSTSASSTCRGGIDSSHSHNKMTGLNISSSIFMNGTS